MSIVIPDVHPEANSMDLAFTLAGAGIYVLPTSSTGDAKHAGSVVGEGWPSKSSRDPQQIADWFSGTSHRCAVHAGRSGLIVADVDHAEELTPELRRAITELDPPFHSTRPDDPGRGHYLFAQPPSRRIGNRAGQTGKAWGEWRGANGIILVGGEGRRWVRTGPVPELPHYLAELLPDVDDQQTAVSDAEVQAFVAEHSLALRPESVEVPIRAFTAEITAGGSRHNAAVAAACWVVGDAVEGRYPARVGLRRLEGEFVPAMVDHGRDGKPVSRAQAEAEFASAGGMGGGAAMAPPRPGCDRGATRRGRPRPDRRTP